MTQGEPSGDALPIPDRPYVGPCRTPAAEPDARRDGAPVAVRLDVRIPGSSASHDA